MTNQFFAQFIEQLFPLCVKISFQEILIFWKEYERNYNTNHLILSLNYKLVQLLFQRKKLHNIKDNN